MTDEPVTEPEKSEKIEADKETLLPELDFTSFILSLSSSALMTLGVIENPVTKKKEKDSAVARQTIDLIALLKEKTVGNLTNSEAKLLDDVLAELQVWYVKETA
jgi:hypothetical protein